MDSPLHLEWDRERARKVIKILFPLSKKSEKFTNKCCSCPDNALLEGEKSAGTVCFPLSRESIRVEFEVLLFERKREIDWIYRFYCYFLDREGGNFKKSQICEK